MEQAAGVELAAEVSEFHPERQPGQPAFTVVAHPAALEDPGEGGLPRAVLADDHHPAGRFGLVAHPASQPFGGAVHSLVVVEIGLLVDLVQITQGIGEVAVPQDVIDIRVGALELPEEFLEGVDQNSFHFRMVARLVGEST